MLMSVVDNHYEGLSETYDDIWTDYPWSEYVPWMNHQIARRLRIREQERVMDVGAGTGMFIKEVVGHVSPAMPMVCVDPSQSMLSRIKPDARIIKVPGDFDGVCDGSAALPYDHFDAIVSKEAIHHVLNMQDIVEGLGALLSPGGRFLVVTLQPYLDYPVFPSAFRRFAEKQPEPAYIARCMKNAGLHVTVQYDQFPVSCSREHYLRLMRNRWLSVLSSFGDDELKAGIQELEHNHPEDRFVFVERRAFILGCR
jgi:SAM-dependent methyltransferase